MNGRHERSGESMARALLAVLADLPARMVRARTPHPSTVTAKGTVTEAFIAREQAAGKTVRIFDPKAGERPTGPGLPPVTEGEPQARPYCPVMEDPCPGDEHGRICRVPCRSADRTGDQ